MSDDGDSEVLESHDVPGWNTVDKLAKALLELEGLCVTPSQASNIKKLYDKLLDIDKRPIRFKPRSVKPTKGRFGKRKQYRVGEATASAVKRYLHVYM